MSSVRLAGALALAAILASSTDARAQVASDSRIRVSKDGAAPAKALPLKYTGKPTTDEITAADLMTRLYIFADDSLMGREVGTKYNDMGTAYIEREVRRLGLVPGGDNGGYFQNLPLYSYQTEAASTMKVGDQALVLGTDFLPYPLDETRLSLDGGNVVFGGTVQDSSSWISADAAAGKIVVLNMTTGVVPPNNQVLRARISGATAIFLVSLDRLPAPSVQQLLGKLPSQFKSPSSAGAAPRQVFLSQRAATLMFGPLDSAKAGAMSRRLSGTIIVGKEQAPGRNVIAILPGSDPALRGQYVAIGSHNDHVGFNNRPVDHDSMKVFNTIARPQGADSPNPSALTAEQSATFRAALDSLRKLNPARQDSIFNGADDDGSGSMTVLEIAEAFATARVKPKRSIIFVWHAGEEKGLWGASYFTDRPTVPRDSIVAQLNMDMVGRGAATDATGESKTGALLRGGPGYLQLVGSRRLSTELGDLMDSVNAKGKFQLNFDYGMDANGHPQNIYCRSDHYEYAKFGIPVVFMTTGGHADYHQVTDEAQYIDYPHMAQIAKYVKAVAAEIANLDHRIVVDKPKPDPKGRCVQ